MTEPWTGKIALLSVILALLAAPSWALRPGEPDLKEAVMWLRQLWEAGS